MADDDPFAQLKSFFAALRSQVDSLQRSFAAFMKRAYIPYAKGRYDETKNPLFAWNAFSAARQSGEPVPDWVLSYFDRVAENLSQLQVRAAKGEKLPASHLAVALEAKKPGRSGRGTIFNDDHFKGFMKEIMLALRVQAEIDRGGQETYAVMEVARIEGVSESSVRRAWQKRKHLVPRWGSDRASEGAVSESHRITET